MKIIYSIFLIIALYSNNTCADEFLTPLVNKPSAPDFLLRDIKQNIVELDDYKGKPLIINFWASWCPPCLAQIPSMNKAWDKIKNDGIQMVGINIGENDEDILEFLKGQPIKFTILLDETEVEIENWSIKGLPTTYVIDPEGRIIYMAIGGREWDNDVLLNKIRALRINKTVKKSVNKTAKK